MGGFQKQVKRGTWLWFWVWLARFFFCKVFFGKLSIFFLLFAISYLLSFKYTTFLPFIYNNYLDFSSNFWKLFSLLQTIVDWVARLKIYHALQILMGYCFSPISWWCSFPNVFFILIDCICILQISSQRSFDFRSGRISTFIYRFCDSHRNWFLGSYFTKAPLSQIQLRFSVGLKTAERQFMTFASPPFNRWDIWGKHQDIALSEGIQKKWRKQKYI